MNSFTKLSFVIGFIFMSISVMGKDKDFSLSFVGVSAKTLKFEISNANNVSLFLYTDTKENLYSEKLTQNTIIDKSYNLANLEEGTYYLVAESDFKIERYKLVIDANNTLSVDKTPVALINKPEYSISKNIVKLHMSDVKGAVKVSVFDSANNLYYNDTKNLENGALNLAFDFNPQNSDVYYITVEKDGDVFNKVIALK